MAFNRITIVLIPNNANKLRQIRIPRILFHLLLFFLLSSVTYLSWLVMDYRMIKSKIPLLSYLEKENRLRKRQSINLVEYVNQVSQTVSELQELSGELKHIADFGKNEDKSHFLGVGGTRPSILLAKYSKTENHDELVRLMNVSLKRLQKEIAVSKKEKIRLYNFILNEELRLAATPSKWPTKGRVSSGFGTRISPFTNQKDFHNGIDISTKKNAPIIAPADGTVSSIRSDNRSGNVFYINHGYGFVTAYAHLNKVLVKEGQFVKRGDLIGLVGNTGESTGPHLHYEVHLNDVPMDPIYFLPDDNRSLKYAQK